MGDVATRRDLVVLEAGIETKLRQLMRAFVTGLFVSQPG
jgi:hypothetical protein